MQYPNPFKPTFGLIPSRIVGRQNILEEYTQALEEPIGNPARTTIFTGTRGMGKTVILNELSEIMAAKGWITVNVTVNNEMLEDIIADIQDKAANIIGDGDRTYISGISVAGFGVDFTKDKMKDVSSWKQKMVRILSELKVRKIGLLLCIDEVRGGSSAMQIIATAYQHFLADGYNVAIAMAGLPQAVNDLLNDHVLTFLRRASQKKLEAVSITEVQDAFRATIEENGRKINREALELAAKATDGYPFLIQAVGYYMWSQKQACEIITTDDVNEGIILAKKQLGETVLSTALRDISAKDQEFVYAIAVDKGVTKVGDVRDRLGVSDNLTSTYRRRLIEEGIIFSKGYGLIDFAIPYMREYLREQLKHEGLIHSNDFLK
ncbi:ATPase AAA [Actinomycetota bacterium]|nr:ATPase AAA [Actinomycetota bacterium]